ncbi:MAG: hypothetical protein NWQ13_03145, partial [Glaciimonas sp.]|nr:hypothetical protein [Glaciimonas sp.]
MSTFARVLIQIGLAGQIVILTPGVLALLIAGFTLGPEKKTFWSISALSMMGLGVGSTIGFLSLLISIFVTNINNGLLLWCLSAGLMLSLSASV